MKDLIVIILTLFGCVSLLLVGVNIYEHSKYSKQVSRITQCDFGHTVKAIRFANFSFDKKREILITDSAQIIQIREYLCNAESKLLLDRIGGIESCHMYIDFEDETIVLALLKDDRDFCRITYTPAVSRLLNLWSTDLAYVFKK